MNEKILLHRLYSVLTLTVAGALTVAVVNVATTPEEEIPLPFGFGTNSDLAGSLTNIGNKNGITVTRVAFPEGTDFETLAEDTLYLVTTPDDPAVTLVPFDDAIVTGGVHSVNYFGYKYSSVLATTEKENRTASLLTQQFPGQFFASAKARAEDSEHGNSLAAFEAANGITMSDTNSLAGARLERNSLYFLVVNEPSGATITARANVNVTCGNGTKEGSESCDDGDTDSGDGCSATCTVESGYTCNNATPNVCGLDAVCGNGTKEGSEACDDGDTDAGDGCSATCTVESGYSCDNATPNVCTLDPVCGNGTKEGSEACDDGDTDSGDGCSATCTVESGYSCDNATPNVCTQNTVCGNGAIESGEICDDGDTDSGDGCSNVCAKEANFRCTGEPSVCISYLDYVRSLADTNNNGVVSDNEALLLTLNVAEAPDMPYDTVSQYDMDQDGDVDNTDIGIILTEIDILAP